MTRPSLVRLLEALERAGARKRGRILDRLARARLEAPGTVCRVVREVVTVDRVMAVAFPEDEIYRANVLKAERVLAVVSS